jgi:hypothetical protein
MGVIMKSSTFWNVTLCSMVTYPALHPREKYILTVGTYLINLACKLKNQHTQNAWFVGIYWFRCNPTMCKRSLEIEIILIDKIEKFIRIPIIVIPYEALRKYLFLTTLIAVCTSYLRFILQRYLTIVL